MRPVCSPEIVRPDREGLAHLPSWRGVPGFINDEHAGIFEATKDLPGWQDPPDSQKLYEMAYHSGQVILEIGVFGGRSAVVELRGAITTAKERGLPPPQYYGVDVDPGFFERTRKTLIQAGLTDRCLLFHGDLAAFMREIPIVPTMVFVDGDHRYPGCWADLNRLRSILLPGTPVMCHDYGGIPGVRRAVDEWIATGAYQNMGRFAGSILLRAAGRIQTPGPHSGSGLSESTFATTRDALLARYLSPTPPGLARDRMHTPIRDLTRAARVELRGDHGSRTASQRAAWPYAGGESASLPPTLPGGAPWPKVSIITPTYNQGKYIEETLLSVRNQGYPNVEHIVMDGGSTDETAAIIERYRDGLARVVSEKDDGQSDAINKGFKLATGDILTWLNSDDMLAPGALAAIALAFHTSGADMVAGECHVYRDGKPISRHLTSCDNGPLPIDDLLDIEGRWLEGQFFYQPEVMFTREIWDKAGDHVRTDLYHSMDYELWVRMAAAGAKLRVIGRPVALFRAHPEQKTAGEVVGGFRAELPRAREGAIQRLGLKWTPRPKATIARQKLRVVLFNDIGYAYGAGIGHRRLAQALLTGGHDVVTLAAASTEHHHAAPKATFDDTLRQISEQKPDLVVVGNLHGADLDPSLLGLIAAKFPTAFLTHDLWLFTGRCAYTNGCQQYLTGCDERCTCDKAHPKLAPELVRPMWQTKRRVISSSPDLYLWANSDWALGKANEALKTMGLVTNRPAPRRIEFGLELDVFRPRDKALCREELGLPQDKFIIMSSASSLADSRKGLKHLADALERLKLADTMAVCVGWFDKGQQAPIPGMRAMGYMEEPLRLATLYSASDLFVGPSLEEAFGQVFIEAAACGTPSVGYPVGGKPEAILDGVSGLLTDSVGPASLAQSIETLYMDAALRSDMGRWARIWAESRWSMSASAHRLFAVMRQQGLVDRFGLLPRLTLGFNPGSPPAPVAIAPTFPGWRPLSGFDHWEGPYPDRALGRCRWAHGPVAKFEIDAPTPGPMRLLISCRCYQEGQRLRLVHAGKPISERDVPADRGAKTDHVLSFDLVLTKGVNTLELHSWKWDAGPRPMAVLVTSISALPRHAAPPPAALNGRSVVEPKSVTSIAR